MLALYLEKNSMLEVSATLWCSAAVGTLAGLGFVVPFITTLAMVSANVILRPLASKINKQNHSSEEEIPVCYKIQVTCLD